MSCRWTVALALAFLASTARPGGAADLDCQIQPHVVVTLSMAAEGIVETVMVDRGDLVEKGQVVAVLESGAERATVALERARTELGNKRLADLEIRRAIAELDRRTLRSPITGVVVQRLLHPGEFAKQSPILKLAQIDPLRVEVYAPVALLGKIRVGSPATVFPEAPIKGGYKAQVVVVDRVVDTASATFGVRLELPNPGYRLPAGLKCTVRFAGS